MLWSRAERNADALFVRALERGELREQLTYAQTAEAAGRWASALAATGVAARDVVPIALPNGVEFAAAYFGALAVGAVPAPMPPPRRGPARDADLATIAERAAFADARIVVVEDAHGAPLPAVTPALAAVCEPASPTTRTADDIALLQFTSGTTGRPRAVQLTDAALLAQTAAIGRALRLDPSVDWAVSWLPLYHDMGLIGFLLTPAYARGHVTLLRTEEFITDASLWVKALSDFRATITGGPPSAYQLCARRLRNVDVTQYDLSRLRIALVGAEQVTPEPLALFADALAPAAFRHAALMPTYGMAENGLAVSIPPLDRGPRFDAIDRRAFVDDGLAAAPDGAAPQLAFASVGPTVDGVSVEIVDDALQPLPERRVGEIGVRGPSLMRGYLHDEHGTRAVLRDGLLLTGDLGYLAGGELHVVGRRKEILIVGGRNYQPGDLEEIAADVDGVFRRRVVAFSFPDVERATESVAIVAESHVRDERELEDLERLIRRVVSSAGYPVNDVLVVPPRTIRSTPNGKLRRTECRDRFLAGELHGAR